MTDHNQATEPRFSFGRNWQGFLSVVDRERVGAAEDSLREMLSPIDLEGRSFLDAGCGSGLFSLAALRLGATRVHSFDFDADSVAATRTLKDRYAASASSWTIERGDLTDSEFCRSLGRFDVVYCWGVAHHTGAMWEALGNTCDLVEPGGRLFVAIYSDQGVRSRVWRRLKRVYNRAPHRLQPVLAVMLAAPGEASAVGRSIIGGDTAAYIRSWSGSDGRRGMSRWHNILDWVGGYPFEVAKPEQVFDFCHRRGFELRRLKTVGRSHGCNQFVFERRAPSPGGQVEPAATLASRRSN